MTSEEELLDMMRSLAADMEKLARELKSMSCADTAANPGAMDTDELAALVDKALGRLAEQGRYVP